MHTREPSGTLSRALSAPSVVDLLVKADCIRWLVSHTTDRLTCERLNAYANELRARARDLTDAGGVPLKAEGRLR